MRCRKAENFEYRVLRRPMHGTESLERRPHDSLELRRPALRLWLLAQDPARDFQRGQHLWAGLVNEVETPER